MTRRPAGLSDSARAELDAIARITATLAPLSDSAKGRVLRYVIQREAADAALALEARKRAEEEGARPPTRWEAETRDSIPVPVRVPAEELADLDLPLLAAARAGTPTDGRREFPADPGF